MKRFVLSAAILAGLSLPALAHPHVWITARAEALVDAQGFVTAIRNTWTMDEDYSAMATEGLDKDGDGKLSEAELVPLSEENLSALQEYEFFTYVYEGGEKITGLKAGNAQQQMQDNKLTLTFDVSLPRKVDTKAKPFTFRVYDPSYFIEITLEQTSASNGCTTTAEAPSQDSNTLATRDMLAEKPADWQPPVEQDFGALFADIVTVSCDGAASPISKDKLLTARRDGADAPAFWQNPSGWILSRQSQFYGQLSGAIRNISGANPISAAFGLMALSFAYGVFHAAGPGHGKAVISGWLLASRQQLRRGLAISALSALFQALSAIVIVSGVLLFVWIAGGVARDAAKSASFWVEAASYVLILGLGLALAWRGIRPAYAKHDHHDHHDHHHHDHHHHGEECGHAHLPDAKSLPRDAGWKQSVSLAFAIGIRPCTGALLVLLFASAAGLYAAGIAATFAMALGTFITVAVIASATVLSRDFALRFAGPENPWAARAGRAVRLVAGLLIALLAASLLAGLLSGQGRFI